MDSRRQSHSTLYAQQHHSEVRRKKAHLYLEDEALPCAIVAGRHPPTLTGEAAEDVLLCIPHHQHAGC